MLPLCWVCVLCPTRSLECGWLLSGFRSGLLVWADWCIRNCDLNFFRLADRVCDAIPVCVQQGREPEKEIEKEVIETKDSKQAVSQSFIPALFALGSTCFRLCSRSNVETSDPGSRVCIARCADHSEAAEESAHLPVQRRFAHGISMRR